MKPEKSITTLFKGFNLLIAIIALSLFAIGGCNDNNNDNGLGGDLDSSQCEELQFPCTTVSTRSSDDGTYAVCILADTTCVFNVDNYLNQIKNNGFNVNNDSALWISAYGGDGGDSEGHGGNSIPGGYAQTTTSVADLKTANSGSAKIYYFLAEDGPTGPNHCGGGGGSATIVTFEDLSLNPSSDPDSSLLVMIAGGSGGASASRASGCTNPDGFSGGFGGIAIAGSSGDSIGEGGGCQDTNFGCGSTSCGDCEGGMGGSFLPQGGSGNDNCSAMTACGGDRTCCLTKQNEPTNGNSGFGGKGGKGGQGVNCTQTGNAGFKNVSGFTFDSGKGGDGGGGNAACIAGGGGGGGGVGGGGAGGHGNDIQTASSGAGGGSFSIMSTQFTKLAPTSQLNAESNPCPQDGCLVINIVED